MSSSEFNENVLNLPENIEIRVSENDPNVIMIGDIPDELLNHPFECAIGDKAAVNYGWNARSGTVGTFFDNQLKIHRRGKKDGSAFLQGVANGGMRGKKAMETLYMVGLDYDNGSSIEGLIERVMEMGVVALAYSTFNHMKGESKVREEAYSKEWERAGWPEIPTNESLSAYLLAHKKITPELASTITEFHKKLDGKDGMTYFVGHAPMERWRVVFPLDKPLSVSSHHGSQTDFIDTWAKRYEIFSASFGTEPDSKCKDISRLFYLPRHAEGNPYKVYVIGGERFLDFSSIDVSSEPKPSRPSSALLTTPQALTGNIYADAANAIGGGSRPLGNGKVAEYSDMPSGVAWQDWFATYAKRLKLADLLRDRVPADDIRKDEDGKLTVPCPFESIHSETEGPDMGFFVMNADDTDTGAFLASCSHTSCEDRPMTDFLHGLILSGIITEEDLTDERYLCQSEDDKAFAKLLKTAQGFGRLTSGKVIDRLYDCLAALDLSPMQHDEIIGVIVSKLGQRKGDVTKALAKAKKEHAKRVERERKEGERRAQNEAAANGESDAVVELNVQTDGMDMMVNASWGALLRMNKDKTRFFNRGNVMTRLTTATKDMQPATAMMTKDMLETELHESKYLRWVKGNGDTVADPHKSVAKLIVNSANRSFPELVSFAHSPFFTKDGDLVSTPGYHAPTGIYYAPKDGLELPDIPEHPSREEAIESKDYIFKNVFPDFPFTDGKLNDGGAGSRAHVLAMLLQPFMREMIPGNTPFYLYQKPLHGTGSSLAIWASAYIALGSEAETESDKESDAEWRKAITGKLIKGRPILVIDNIRRYLDSASLCNLATCGTWGDRLLGRNEDVSIRVWMMTVLAGNNVRMSGELSRRCVPIGLDSGGLPTERAGFTRELETWVVENRAKLVAAVLTIIRYWINEGRPEWRGRPLASFGGWSRIMGGVLQAIGVEGFLGNLDMTAEASATEDDAWPDFLRDWFDNLGAKARRVGNPVVSSGKEPGEFDGPNSLVPFVEQGGHTIGMKGESEAAKAASLGGLIFRRKGRVYKCDDGRVFRLDSDGRGAGNKQMWRVEKVEPNPWAIAAGLIFLNAPDECDEEEVTTNRWNRHRDAIESEARWNYPRRG